MKPTAIDHILGERTDVMADAARTEIAVLRELAEATIAADDAENDPAYDPLDEEAAYRRFGKRHGEAIKAYRAWKAGREEVMPNETHLRF